MDKQTNKPAARSDRGKPNKNQNAITPRPDTAHLLKLRLEKHLSYDEISELTGMPKTTVYERLVGFERLVKNPNELQAYEQSRGKILAGAELQLLGELANPNKIEKASLNNVAYAFGQIHQARRLEEGLSTSNQSTIEVALQLIRERKSGAANHPDAIDITPEGAKGGS